VRGALLFVLVGGAAFATSGPLARYARPADPLVVVLGRLTLAALVLVLLDARALATSLRGLSRRGVLGVIGAGALLAAHFACFQWGLEHTSLPAAVSLVSLEPLSVVLVAWAWFGIRPTWGERLGLGLATCGAFVVGTGAGEGDHSLLGDAAVVLAVLLFGFYLAAARGLKQALPTRSYVALVYTTAAASMALVLPFSLSRPMGAAFALEPHSLVAIGLLALVPTLIGHTAVQAASRTLPPAIVALVCPGETLGGIAIGAAVFGAVPTARELLGAVLILAGGAAALLSPRAPDGAEVQPGRR
jgi:drug/metabolite transporter (DMT)-like permease